MDSFDEQIQYFYMVLQTLLDKYLPYIRVVKYTGDKPWVTSQLLNGLICLHSVLDKAGSQSVFKRT